MKREREEGGEDGAAEEGGARKQPHVEHEQGGSLQGGGGSGQEQQQEQQQQEQQQQQGSSEDDEGPHLPRSTSRAAVKKGAECPYLDTVSRQARVAAVHACRRASTMRMHWGEHSDEDQLEP